MNRKKSETLLTQIGKVLHRQELNDVMPALITACAGALIYDADGDLDRLEQVYQKFCVCLRVQVGEMMNADLDESARATKQ
jgi:hypothetical protein